MHQSYEADLDHYNVQDFIEFWNLRVQEYLFHWVNLTGKAFVSPKIYTFTDMNGCLNFINLLYILEQTLSDFFHTFLRFHISQWAEGIVPYWRNKDFITKKSHHDWHKWILKPYQPTYYIRSDPSWLNFTLPLFKGNQEKTIFIISIRP